MAMELRWVGEDELDRVVQTRARCYYPAQQDIAACGPKLYDDRRAGIGDYLIVEQDREAVGTATSYQMMMWVRGRPIVCQGVGWVGTIKTHRRRSGASVASKVMTEALRLGRERRAVVSALMPFRASFYERFGYGLAERRNEWTIPISILPGGSCDGIRFMRESDLPQVKHLRQRTVERGQCDIERTDAGWQWAAQSWPCGYCVVDQHGDRTLQSWMLVTEIKRHDKTYLRISDAAWDSPDALRRTLHWLSTLSDQYSFVNLTLPADFQMNRLLTESQIPHRPVEHFAATFAPQTRMQLRILDHVRFLNGLKCECATAGRCVVEVRENEGEISKFRVELENKTFIAEPTDETATLITSDKIWASIACGDLRASEAARFGLLDASDRSILPLLDALADGPAPFCNEYF